MFLRNVRTCFNNLHDVTYHKTVVFNQSLFSELCYSRRLCVQECTAFDRNTGHASTFHLSSLIIIIIIILTDKGAGKSST